MLHENHCYPFGLKMEGKWAPQIGKENMYGYNGKELNSEFGLEWNDYGARFYDSAIGRWGQVDPLASKMTPWSPYNYVFNNPMALVDPNGESPISALAKMVAKQGVKAGIRNYAEKRIKRRLKKYMSEGMSKEFAKDLGNVLETLDNSLLENVIELVPVVGDLYGATKFGKKVAKAYDKLQDLENKYVGKIFDALPASEKKKFKKNMRKNGVNDAKKDQKEGISNGDKYEKGKVDGHHKEKVSDNPDKMADPRNIEMMTKERHKEHHKKNGY